MPSRIVIAATIIFSISVSNTVLARATEHETVVQATEVLGQIMSAPAQQIPQQLLVDAQAVVIVPRMKGGAFVVGIRKGRGVLVVREANGGWRAPQFVEMTGGSLGWQAGIQSSDVILVFRSRKSLNNLMNGKLTIGADASVAAGPVGRQVAAATDLDLSAEIYSYSRSRGAFVGVSIDGTVLKSDPQAAARYYSQSGELPQSASRLIGQLATYAGGMEPMTAPQVANTSLVLPNPPEASLNSEPQQLIQAHNRLLALLDPSWKSYLTLPKSAFQSTPLSAGQHSELTGCLQRYENVAAQPQYAQISSRAEFQQVMAMLQVIVSQPTEEQLVLPPPPTGSEIPQLRFSQ